MNLALKGAHHDSNVIVLMLASLFALTSIQTVVAQSTTGTISGNVTDASGAGVVAAKGHGHRKSRDQRAPQRIKWRRMGVIKIVFLPIELTK